MCCWHHHHCYYFMINSSFLFLNIIDEDSQPITHGVCRKGVVEDDEACVVFVDVYVPDDKKMKRRRMYAFK